VEAVADGGDAEDSDQVADPDGGVEEAEFDAGEGGIDGFEDDGAVGLDAVADSDDAWGQGRLGGVGEGGEGEVLAYRNT
jgi:hypothetical protein